MKISRIRKCFHELLDSWETNWVYSKHPGKEFGKFVSTPGKFYHDAEDKGVYFTMFLSSKIDMIYVNIHMLNMRNVLE